MRKYLFLALAIVSTSFSWAQHNELLERYRVMALKYNPDLKSAERNAAISKEYEDIARDDMKPKLSAGANFQYTGNPMELNISLSALPKPISFQGSNTNYGASATILQPIYAGGRLLETLRVAKLQNNIAIFQTDYIRSLVCFETDIKYWNSVAMAETVGVMEEFHNSVAKFTQSVKERVEAGLIDRQEQLMAEVKLNEAQFQLMQAEANLETTIMSLNSMIGVALNYPTEVEVVVPPIISVDTQLMGSGNVRDEINIANERIEIEKSGLKLNDAKYRPQLHVGAEGSYSSPGYNFNADLDANYAVYAKLSVPIFEWGKRKSERRASGHKVAIATDNLIKTQDRVSLEINSSRTAYIQAVERVNLASSSLEKAFENEAKALDRYKEGKISIVEVIDAQVYRQTSQINYTQAKAAAQIYRSELVRALNM